MCGPRPFYGRFVGFYVNGFSLCQGLDVCRFYVGLIYCVYHDRTVEPSVSDHAKCRD